MLNWKSVCRSRKPCCAQGWGSHSPAVATNSPLHSSTQVDLLFGWTPVLLPNQLILKYKVNYSQPQTHTACTARFIPEGNSVTCLSVLYLEVCTHTSHPLSSLYSRGKKTSFQNHVAYKFSITFYGNDLTHSQLQCKSKTALFSGCYMHRGKIYLYRFNPLEEVWKSWKGS